jgi:hypothetical protein
MSKYFDFESDSEHLNDQEVPDQPDQEIVFTRESQFYTKSIFTQALLFSEIIKIDN